MYRWYATTLYSYMFQYFSSSWVVRCHIIYLTSKTIIFITRGIWPEKSVGLAMFCQSIHLFLEVCVVLAPKFLVSVFFIFVTSDSMWPTIFLSFRLIIVMMIVVIVMIVVIIFHYFYYFHFCLHIAYYLKHF